jgi:beta-lactamase superfamily II metal-dependent hydrolase
MQLELTYQMPYRRLRKLGWSASLKAFRTLWLLYLLLFAGYVAAAAGIVVYADALEKWTRNGFLWALALVSALYLLGAVLLRGFKINQAKRRVDFNEAVRLTMDTGGIRIGTDSIEYYLKWKGIGQMLIEHDGVVVSHRSAFFIVPDTAFANAGERLAFIRDVYGRLSEDARARSEKHIRPIGAPEAAAHEVMQLELTYQMPYRRLRKLSWSMSRKVLRTWWLLLLLLFAGYVAAIAGIAVYADALDKLMRNAGIPYGSLSAIALVIALVLTGFVLLRRFNINQVRRRVDLNEAVRLTMDDGGIRIGGDPIEYYLKWKGIGQMLIEHDGVVVSHGRLFFLVPDAAFADAAERLAFIGDVYGRLNEEARARSEKHIRPVLGP